MRYCRLANKQDKPNALDEVDICEQLGVESAVNANKCPCRMVRSLLLLLFEPCFSVVCTVVCSNGKKNNKKQKDSIFLPIIWLCRCLDIRTEHVQMVHVHITNLSVLP